MDIFRYSEAKTYIAWPNISNQTSNIAHHDIVMVGIKRPRRVSL